MIHFFDWVHIILKRFNGAYIENEIRYESFGEGDIGGV